MKKILVPTDFSDHAEYALKSAAQIARQHNCAILLVHMLELPQEGSEATKPNGADIPEIIFFKNMAMSKFEDLLDADYLEGLDVSETTRFGKVYEGINEVAKTENADFIVMGSHGASGFHEMFIGSNSEKVVRSSEIPVLVIKNEIPEFKADSFVFASDFSGEIKKPFKQMLDIARTFKAHLNLVMINTPNSFKPTHVAEEMMTSFLRDVDYTDYSLHIYNDVNVEKGVLNFANKVNADIIGLSTHGRTGFSHFFNGSISEDLVNHAVRPVLTFKI
ncbi:universal stress protein [Flavobacterium silvaticum]|uniref:Universal stress protein n=1 Tax=Flavobacterium silvaticum TaxID=1852020 RepID=A0A972FJF8_9FLAO|nr:universal stress protein [Flavobacterium silvaticum]NMH27076.1 universal stress protein [Flavobacterium silvaticum]